MKFVRFAAQGQTTIDSARRLESAILTALQAMSGLEDIQLVILEGPPPVEVLLTRLSQFDMSVRLEFWLKRMKLQYAGDVVVLTEERIKYHRLAERSRQELKAILLSLNLALGMDLDSKTQQVFAERRASLSSEG